MSAAREQLVDPGASGLAETPVHNGVASGNAVNGDALHLAPDDRRRVTYDLRLLESFLVLAEERHFGRAAERLAFAQPALSQQIRRLETQLGVPLFTRDARNVQLTAAGAAFHEQAQVSVLAAIEAGQDAVSATNEVSGSLAIAVGPDLVAIARSLFSQFSEDHPNVRAEIITGVDANCLKALRQGTVDAIMAWSTGLPYPGLEQTSTPIADDTVSARLVTSHRLASFSRIPFDELQAERLIMFPRDAAPGPYDQLVASFGGPNRQGGVEQITHVGPDARQQMIDALDDESFTLGPTLVDDDERAVPEIVRREIIPVPATLRLWLSWNGIPDRPLRAFADSVRRAYEAKPSRARASKELNSGKLGARGPHG